MFIHRLSRFLSLKVSEGALTSRIPVRALPTIRAFNFAARPTDEEIEEEVSQQNEAEAGNFDRFSILPVTQQTLRKMGVKHLFPIQAQTYHLIHRGTDVIGKDKTGSGKTFAFLLPIFERMRANKAFQKATAKNPTVFIVTPTRELALQVSEEALKLKNSLYEFGVVPCYGGASRVEQINRLKRNVSVVVGTPGRLKDLIECGALELKNVEVMVLDEMDLMLDMGFMGDIELLLNFIQNAKKVLNKGLGDIQFLMFSATVPPTVRKLASQFLKPDCVFINLAGDSDKRMPSTISHYGSHFSSEEAMTSQAVEIAKKVVASGRTILIFANRRQETNLLHHRISQYLNCGKLSSDVEQTERTHSLKRFKSKIIKCLVATSVAARGLDIPDIDVVMQVGIPPNTKEFVHRCGRTGRAGKDGISIVLTTRQDEFVLRELEKSNEIKIKSLESSDFWEGIRNLKLQDLEQSRYDSETQKGGIKPGQPFSFTTNFFDKVSKFEFRGKNAKAAEEDASLPVSSCTVVVRSTDGQPMSSEIMEKIKAALPREFGLTFTTAKLQMDLLGFRLKMDEPLYEDFANAVNREFGGHFEVSVQNQDGTSKTSTRSDKSEDNSSRAGPELKPRVTIRQNGFPINFEEFLDLLKQKGLVPTIMKIVSIPKKPELGKSWRLEFATPSEVEAVAAELENLRSENGEFSFKVE